MKIFGKIDQAKYRQLVGIYAKRYDKWHSARITAVEESFVRVVTNEGAHFSFDFRGNCLTPDSGAGTYFLAHCGPIPARYRYSDDDKITRNYLADSYSEFAINAD